MKKALLAVLGALALLLVTGCPILLVSALGQDLILTVGRFDPTGNTVLATGVGGTLYIPVTITDQNGRAVEGTFEVTFTLRDAVPTDLDTTTLTVPAGSEQIVAWESLDAAVVAGTYDLVATLTVPEETEDLASNNNTVVRTVTVAATAEPDLAVSVDVPGGGIYPPEGTFSVVFQVMNLGGGEIADGADITLDFTVNLSGTDVSLGTTTVTLTEVLYPGFGSLTGAASLTMPVVDDIALDNGETATTFTTWTENMTVTVDSPDDYTESNEANNTDATVALTSRSVFPDLGVQSVTFSDPAVIPGHPVAVKVVVENMGAAPAAAGSYSVELYLDENDDFVPDAAELIYTFGAADAPAVPYDDNLVANTAVFVVPADSLFDAGQFTYAGAQHRFLAQVVGETDLVEWDPFNNGANSAAQYFLFPGSYDLEPGPLVLDTSSIADGGDITGTLVIRNHGEDDLDDSITVELYGSNNLTLVPAGDTLLGSDVIAVTIAAGGETTVDITVAVSDTLNISEMGYIYAEVDTTDVIGEIDETNNDPPNVASGAVTTAAFGLVYDDEDGARTYDLRVVVFGPTPTATAATIGGGELYDDTGTLSTDLGFTALGSYFVYGLTPGTYNLHLTGSGPYGILVTGQTMSFRYFPLALSSNASDTYEPDDDATANVPDAPVSVGSGIQLNRFAGPSDEDWFTFTLP